MKHWLISTALTGVLFTSGAHAQDVDTQNLLNLSLAQLSNIEVTSVSKKAEKASEAAAAIYVITQDDIRRSGMTSIPEVLRIVPGLDVAQSGAHQWSISSRGFNDQFSNKMLVLIDGRTVYTPLYSGVFWDVQDTPLQDIERIEVIRGPGATQWGANAVNGVINIITKNAKDTQGGLVSASVGTLDRSLNTVRYGAKIDDTSYLRTYAKYDDRDEVRDTADHGAHDAWNKIQGGFRADMTPSSSQSFTLQGDIYHGGESGLVNMPVLPPALASIREIVSGGNVLGRWTDKLSSTSELTTQAYYDDARRDHPLYQSNIQTMDLDVQHVWSAIERNEIVSGLAYRLVKSSVQSTPYITFTPGSRTDNLFSAFVQDKVTLHPNDVFLTLGSKLEHNDYTGFEYEPSARLSWLLDNKQTLWSSVSRAVRTPNIAQADSQLVLAQVNAGPNAYVARGSDKTTDSEDLIAYELGYRIQPASNISVDLSTFYNKYNNLVVGITGATAGPLFSPAILGAPYFLTPILPVNLGKAHAWGGELSTKWNPVSYLELAAGYSLEQIKFEQPSTTLNTFAGKAPQQQFNLRSTLTLPHNVEWNTAFYYVDDLAAADLYSPFTSTPNYLRMDMRLAWKPLENLELSLVGQNLLDNAHKEFNGFVYQNSSQIPRSVYGNITWKF